MGSFKSYQDLIVWQKSMFLVKEVYLLSANLPTDEKFGLKSQIQRSAVSIPSNIAEGWGRGYNKNFIQFLNISNGSLSELETQLILCRDLNLLKVDEDILNLCGEIGKMIYSLKKNIKSKMELTSH